MTATCAGRARRAGFSLLEVVIAAALLLVIVSSVTVCVTGVARAGRRAEAGVQTDRALAAVLARLAGLLYCAPVLPSPGDEGHGETDLLAAVFPNADVSIATADARYVAADEGRLKAGSFVTRSTQAGIRVECVARFRDSFTGDWLAPGDLTGWSVSASSCPPAPVLVVEVTAVGGAAPRTGQLVREAAADAAPVPQPGATVIP